MKAIVITGLIVMTLFLSCKKESPGTGENSSSEVTSEQTEDKKPDTSDIETALEKMQGDVPKSKYPLIDVPLVDLEGQTVNLSDYKGKVIMLNLWATWCPPCKKEMPSMEELHKAYKDKGFVILAVSVGEPKNTVADFLKKTPYSFPIFIDPDNQVSGSYGTGSIPTTYLIDKEGFLAARFVGGRDWFSEDAKTLVELFLAL